MGTDPFAASTKLPKPRVTAEERPARASRAASSSEPRPNFQALTGREQEVLRGVASGERNKEIALKLGVTKRMVDAYLNTIYTKLNVDSRAAAVAIAMEHGLLSQQEEPTMVNRGKQGSGSLSK